MINLLPYEHKNEIRAARTNVILVRYIAILIVAAIVLGGLVVGAYVVMNGTKVIAEQKVSENQVRVAAYQSIKTEADAFRADLATAKTILDSSISFSTLIYQIAATIPPNVVIDDLPLDPSTFGSNMTIKASAKSFDDVTKLQNALERNNQVFSDVQLQNIKKDSASGNSDNYPVKATLTVVVNKGALQ